MAMIMDVQVTTVDNKIRVKFLAIPGSCGLEITMDRALAEQVITKLTTAMSDLASQGVSRQWIPMSITNPTSDRR